MTTAAQSLPVDELRAQARTRAAHAAPGHGLATAFAAVFAALGWLAGRLILVAVFAGVSARYGYWRGKGLTDEDIAARIAASRIEEAHPPVRPVRSKL